MHALKCPTCNAPLPYSRGDKHVNCSSGHTFDASKDGYLNLLMSHQKHSKQPGDGKDMLLARRSFLDAGHYARLVDQIASCLVDWAPQAKTLVDLGCGEGYYLNQLSNKLPYDHQPLDLWGLDISKEAVRLAAKRNPQGQFLVASTLNLPFMSDTIDVLLGVFSPLNFVEGHRVLKQGGILIYVFPYGDHLRGLRELVYQGDVLEKDNSRFLIAPSGFTLVSQAHLAFEMNLEARDAEHLLAMTPHYWRIPSDRRQIVAPQRGLKVSMGLVVYQKGVGQ